MIITHYIAYLSFQLLRNHRILQHINYSFLYLKVLVKPELSMHVPMRYQNILLRSEGFTEQSLAIENKFLPRTVLRLFLHKLERNII